MDVEDFSEYPDDPEELKKRLFEAENNIKKVVEIGQGLLEETNNLKCQLDDLRKSTDKKLEQAEQEKYILQNKYDQKVSAEEWFTEELNNQQQQLLDAKKNLRETLKAEKAHEITRLSNKIDELKTDQEYASSKEAQLLQKVSELEELLQENLKNVDAHTNRSFDKNEEFGVLYEEQEKLLNENTTLKAQLIERKSEVQGLICENEKFHRQLVDRDEELEAIRCQFVSVNNALEEARTDKLDLKCQLDALQMENSHHNKKGNSIFSELDDRRIGAEKKLITLQVLNKSLQEKYAVEKQQNQNYKRKISQLLMEASSGQVDMEYVHGLEGKLASARNELKIVLEEKEQLQQKPNVMLPVDNPIGPMADKDYQQYLLTIIKQREDEKETTAQELRMKTIKLLDEQSKSSQLESQLKAIESEKQKLHGKNIQLCLKVDKLLWKYEPDSVKKSGALTVKRTEKIPMQDPADIKIKETCRNQTNSFINQSKSMTQLTDITLKKSNVDTFEKTGVKLLDCLKKTGKSVSISDEVEVHEIDNLNQNDDEQEVGVTPKKKATYAEVKHVQKEYVNKLEEVNECNTQ